MAGARDALMNILNIGINNLANISTNLAYGINTYTAHRCRSVSLYPPPFNYDFDILLRDNEKLVEDLVEESDVFHLNSWSFSERKTTSGILGRLPVSLIRRIAFKRRDRAVWYHFVNYVNRRKINSEKTVLQYHGSDLRRALSSVDKQFVNRRGFKVLVSVPDLLPHLGNTQWLPIPVPTNGELYTPPQKRSDDVIRVVHTPTARSIKKTEVIIQVVDELKKKYDVELMLIENMPYRQCLELKKNAHISFDNIGFGSYASCSIEAMCHEQPTLVYLNDTTIDQVNKVSEKVGIEHPFVNVGGREQPSTEHLYRVMDGQAHNVITREDYESVYESVERLIVDSSLRKELGTRGRRWASKVHDVRPVVERLITIYES